MEGSVSKNLGIKKSKKTNSKVASERAEDLPAVRRVRVDEIKVKGDFRKLDQEVVQNISDSIREVGLLHPITVSIKESDDEESSGQIYLVAGRHRLEAIKKLGSQLIDVIVVKRI